MSKWKKKRQHRPEGTVRRSQVVTTYGPGSMIDLVHQAGLVGGIDFWSEGEPIQEPRLREHVAGLAHIAQVSKAAGRPFEGFRAAPACSDRDPDRSIGIEVLEFPTWLVCQKCRALVSKFDGSVSLKSGRYAHACGGRGGECVPVRFLGACANGHCQDWPWRAFVHAGAPICTGGQLKLIEDATGDFSKIRVICTCGASRGLVDGFRKENGFRCKGRRPWLGGEEANEECDERLRLLVRTASNSYFSQVLSALSIEDPTLTLSKAVDQCWDVLQAADANTLTAFRTIPKVRDAIPAARTDGEVLALIEAKRTGQELRQDPLRTAEYRQFVQSPVESPGERAPDHVEFFARKSPRETPQKIESIILATKLREVRAQVGFTRLEPASLDLQGELSVGVQVAPLALRSNWLPATEVLGEGIFLRLDEIAVREWEQRPSVKARERKLRNGFDCHAAQLQSAGPGFPGIRYYLLHSLSHLLITAISLECGYSASSIRERIYCAGESEPVPMAAILLHTGSTGSEGTLGGLVEQGRRIEAHLSRAWENGRLCANDPVCANHDPADDPAERFVEGAACHGCLYIAETSCERFNHMLDRALVVPTVGNVPKDLAFFSERPGA